MRASKAGLEAQSKEAHKIGWLPPVDEMVAYQSLIDVGSCYASNDVAGAVAGMELCYRVLHHNNIPPEKVPFGFCIYGVVAIGYEARLAQGHVRACEACGAACTAKKSRPCKKFIAKIRPIGYEALVTSMEALIGTLGIQRRHIDMICSVAADQEPLFKAWHKREYSNEKPTM